MYDKYNYKNQFIIKFPNNYLIIKKWIILLMNKVNLDIQIMIF